jgi:hypothetical protein
MARNYIHYGHILTVCMLRYRDELTLKDSRTVTDGPSVSPQPQTGSGCHTRQQLGGNTLDHITRIADIRMQQRDHYPSLNRTRSYKKDDEPLLNLTGAMSRCSRENVLMCTHSKYRTCSYKNMMSPCSI